MFGTLMLGFVAVFAVGVAPMAMALSWFASLDIVEPLRSVLAVGSCVTYTAALLTALAWTLDKAGR